MRRLGRPLEPESGVAMAMVVMMIAVLTLLAVVLIDQVTAESNRAAVSVTSDAVYQAAEAGVNDYIAKLTDDPQFYDHCVAKGESTRQRADTGALVAHAESTTSCDPGGPSAWKAGVRWTYPNGKDQWFAGTGGGSTSTVLQGYAYNLMIEPPSQALATNYVTIVSTGCKVLDPNAATLQCDPSVNKRAIEVHVRRTTPADFQYMMTDMHNANVCWASNIYGKMYSTGEIKVCGAHAYGNMMAESYVTGSPLTLLNGARIYDLSHPNIRDVVRNPISFSDFFVSVSDIQRAAKLNQPAPNGTDFEDPSASAWRIIFSSDGNMHVWKCKNLSGTAEGTQPYCNDIKLSATVTLPKTGTSPGTATVSVNEDTGSFPSSGTIYIGTSPGRVDTFQYTSKTSNSFYGKCTTCSTGPQTHNSGETVSLFAVGQQPGFDPVYDGPLPSNGAVYTGQDAVISWPTAINNGSYTSNGSSILNGRVGVASAGDVIIAGNIHYASEAAPNGIGGADDDVLGLIAQNNFWLGNYAPNQLWFRAATIALTGLWGDYRCSYGGSRGSTSSMTFVGTSAYYSNSGCMYNSGGDDGYNTARVYRITDDGTASSCPTTAPACASYDALKFLFPPWFPVINGMETTVLFREVPSSFVPADVPAA
jgi:Tfp pilus assembly protein PilX